MARSDTKHASLGPALAARPPEEGPVDAVRHVMRDELSGQLADPLVVRELQVMLTTPSLRNLAREHFYDEESDMAGAVATRLGLPADDLTVQVITSVIASTLWTTVNRWTTAGAEVDDLLPMIDRALSLVAEGVDAATASSAAKPPSRRRAR